MKKISYVLLLFIGIFICMGSAKASTSVTVKSNKTNVVVGNTVEVTVTYYSSNILAQAYGTVTYDSKVLKLTSGSLAISYSIGDEEKTSKSYTYKFTAIGSGIAKISVSDPQIYELKSNSTKAVTPSVSSASVKVITQAQLEASYSKNNNLSSLSIEGYELNFNKDTLEYNLEVENNIEKINIMATKEDSTASINGSGEVNLSEGINNLKVVVTAQNGNEKTYIINVTRKELNPITTNINGKEYTVIRKKEFMPEVNSIYTESTVLIGEDEVPSFNSSNINLVALKDSEGNIGLFKYDNGKYSEYKELVAAQTIINILDEETSVPKGYEKVSLDINGKVYSVYKNNDSDMYLVYGLNVVSGNKGLYKYDKLENTIQKYEDVKNNENLYFMIIAGLGAFIVISYIVFIICMNKKGKVKPDKNNRELNKKEEILKTMAIDIGEIKKEVNPKTKKEEKKQQKKLEKEKREIEEALKLKKEQELKAKYLEDKKRMKLEKKHKNKNDEDEMARL